MLSSLSIKDLNDFAPEFLSIQNMVIREKVYGANMSKTPINRTF